MDKITIMLVVLIVVLVLTILIIPFSITALASSSPEPINLKASTKAICDNNSCQDYFIECKNSEPVSMTPITGASIKIDDDWEDPRTQKEKFCN